MIVLTIKTFGHDSQRTALENLEEDPTFSQQDAQGNKTLFLGKIGPRSGIGPP